MNIFEKYAHRIDKQPGDGCWNWTGQTYMSGYGLVAANGTNYRAHRLAWEHENGPIGSPAIFVMHRCDNKQCVRPSHLFLGDHRANMADAASKGRFKRGESHYATRLNEVAVRVIRYFLERGMPQKRLARAYGVHVRIISGINVRRTWKHVA